MASTARSIHRSGSALSTRAQSRVRAARLAKHPAHRFGQPEGFGAACALLCSAHAGYIDGQNLLMDGGSFPRTM
jgi:3-oxoacyl-[acyl-carrier protein] reductase|tara:strand:+ start:741 stop:962 length:222 start_codon:yes stop_codon:yes gene_type:complete